VIDSPLIVIHPQAIGCVHSFLNRAIDHSAVHMISVMLRTFDVPLLTPSELRNFCENDKVSI